MVFLMETAGRHTRGPDGGGCRWRRPSRRGLSYGLRRCRFFAKRSASVFFLCSPPCYLTFLPRFARVARDRLLTVQAEFVLFKLRQMGAVSEEDISLCRQLFQLLVSDLSS